MVGEEEYVAFPVKTQNHFDVWNVKALHFVRITELQVRFQNSGAKNENFGLSFLVGIGKGGRVTVTIGLPAPPFQPHRRNK